MNTLSVLKVVFIIILCIGSSYTDIKFGYVKNSLSVAVFFARNCLARFAVSAF